MNENLEKFLVESRRNLDRLDHDLEVLESEPHRQETLGSIFRTIHAFKISSGFLGFGKLEAVANVCENLFSKLWDGGITFNPELASALRTTVGSDRYMLGQIEVTGEPGDQDFSGLINLLTRLSQGQSESTESDALPASGPAATTAVAGKPDRAVVAPKSEAVVSPSLTPAEKPKAASTVSDGSVCIDVELLDKLMNLVGELVTARNQVIQSTGQHANDHELQDIAPLAHK